MSPAGLRVVPPRVCVLANRPQAPFHAEWSELKQQAQPLGTQQLQSLHGNLLAGEPGWCWGRERAWGMQIATGHCVQAAGSGVTPGGRRRDPAQGVTPCSPQRSGRAAAGPTQAGHFALVRVFCFLLYFSKKAARRNKYTALKELAK